MFFENIKLVKSPCSTQRVIFQCDEFYFRNYGFYNLLSCDELNQDVHIHFINVSDEFLSKVLDLRLSIDLSISCEILNTDVNFYKLKSYYFTSRYFITDYLFSKNLIDLAYVIDADIIFNEKISLQNSKLGVLYYPEYKDNLWKQTGANFLLISKDRKDFLKKIIEEYHSRLSQINFECIHEKMPKYERANMYALDQVCMSIAMQSEDTKSLDFINLNQIENFIGNKNMTCKIWSLTARKNNETQKILLNRFKRSF